MLLPLPKCSMPSVSALPGQKYIHFSVCSPWSRTRARLRHYCIVHSHEGFGLYDWDTEFALQEQDEATATVDDSAFSSLVNQRAPIWFLHHQLQTPRTVASTTAVLKFASSDPWRARCLRSGELAVWSFWSGLDQQQTLGEWPGHGAGIGTTKPPADPVGWEDGEVHSLLRLPNLSLLRLLNLQDQLQPLILNAPSDPPTGGQVLPSQGCERQYILWSRRTSC